MSVTIMKPTKTAVPGHPMLFLRDEIDRLFDTVFTGSPLSAFERWDFDMPRLSSIAPVFRATWPKADMSETDKAYIITTELPGMDENDIEVSFSDHILTISGEKSREIKEGDDDTNFHLMERSYGTVRRTFRVPDGIDEKKISAEFEHGVLTLTLPKGKVASPKTIPVKGKAAKKPKARKTKKAS